MSTLPRCAVRTSSRKTSDPRSSGMIRMPTASRIRTNASKISGGLSRSATVVAGAWASRHLAPATTVAERLNPPEIFDAFVRMRDAVGMRIIPLDRGSDVFRELVRTAQRGRVLIPLLAEDVRPTVERDDPHADGLTHPHEGVEDLRRVEPLRHRGGRGHVDRRPGARQVVVALVGE